MPMPGSLLQKPISVSNSIAAKTGLKGSASNMPTYNTTVVPITNGHTSDNIKRELMRDLNKLV